MSNQDLLTAERLNELLDYNPYSGEFTWRYRKCSRFSGRVAGCTDRTGHIVIRIDGVNHRAHKLAWLAMEGRMPDAVRHIDGKHGNNRWANLVALDDGPPCDVLPGDTKTGVAGVFYRRSEGKWRVIVKDEGALVYIGLFDSFDAAVAARKRAEMRH